MEPTTIVVDGVVATDRSVMSLKEEAWSIALDQQAFGPCRLLVATADRAGHLLAIAHTIRTVPPELALACDSESELVRSTRLALAPRTQWWDVP